MNRCTLTKSPRPAKKIPRSLNIFLQGQTVQNIFLTSMLLNRIDPPIIYRVSALPISFMEFQEVMKTQINQWLDDLLYQQKNYIENEFIKVLKFPRQDFCNLIKRLLHTHQQYFSELHEDIYTNSLYHFDQIISQIQKNPSIPTEKKKRERTDWSFFQLKFLFLAIINQHLATEISWTQLVKCVPLKNNQQVKRKYVSQVKSKNGIIKPDLPVLQLTSFIMEFYAKRCMPLEYVQEDIIQVIQNSQLPQDLKNRGYTYTSFFVYSQIKQEYQMISLNQRPMTDILLQDMKEEPTQKFQVCGYFDLDDI